MNVNIFKLISLFLMIALLFSITTQEISSNNPYAQANGVVTINTNRAIISVTGGSNVPFFQIQLNGSNQPAKVKFSSIQEFVDTNNDGKFQTNESVALSGIALPSLTWTFGGFSTVNNSNGITASVGFNFTTNVGNSQMQFRTHINFSSGNSLKFDLVFKNYIWISTNPNAKLAIKFQITGGNLTTGVNASELLFGNAEFNSASTAATSSGSIDVSTQIDTASTFYLIFNHFNSGFELDPTFTVSNTGSTSSSSNTSVKSSPGFEFIPLVAGLSVIGIVYTKRRYHI